MCACVFEIDENLDDRVEKESPSERSNKTYHSFLTERGVEERGDIDLAEEGNPLGS